MEIHTEPANLNTYKTYLRLQEETHSFMKQKNYLQIDAPVLSPALIPESYLDIFKTEFSFFDRKQPMYLTPSAELFLKRLLTQGVGNCYYLGHCFRNSEPQSTLHSPEFTMLEFYKLGIDYKQMGDELLELMQHLCMALYGSHDFEYQGKKISVAKWEKLSVAEAFDKYSGISADILFDETKFLKKSNEKGYKTEGFAYEDLFSQIFSQEIEPKLGTGGYPTLVYDYPYQMASLAMLNEDRVTAQRIEFYINGIEIGGCCTELADWQEQEKRFESEDLKRHKHGLVPHAIDKGFIQALKYGLPYCTGSGVGFDRLAMVLSNASSIKELRIVDVY